jgi:predicted DNA binding CopG/RHH family protein
MRNTNNAAADNEIYSKEELELFKMLEDGIDNGTYKPMSGKELEKAKEYYKGVADNTIKKITKKKSLNLRVYENDIPRIKALALEKGLPYQTLLTSIIHQVATRQIKI